MTPYLVIGSAAVWLAAALPLGAVAAEPGAATRAEQCNYHTRLNVELSDDSILLSDDTQIYRLHDDSLLRNGTPVALDPEQRQALRDYQQQLRIAVPLASQLVVDASTLGMQAALSTLELLGGADAERMADLTTEFAALQGKLSSVFNGRQLPSSTDHVDAVAADIDDLVSAVARDLLSSSLTLVATALFHPSALEQRAEEVERHIETLVEPKAKALERDAHRLCGEFQRLDQLENQISAFDLVAEPQGNDPQTWSIERWM